MGGKEEDKKKGRKEGREWKRLHQEKNVRIRKTEESKEVDGMKEIRKERMWSKKNLRREKNGQIRKTRSK